MLLKRLLFAAIVLCFTNYLLAHPSWGIVVDKYRNVYFTDISIRGGSVWRLSPNGELDLLMDNIHAHNVSLDNEGNVITAHGEGNHTMIRISPDGCIDTLYHTLNHTEFFGGNCTWSERDGIIYGLGQHEHLRSIDSFGYQRDIGKHKFEWNRTIYAAPDGTIYANDIGVDNGTVVRIDTNGTASTIATNLISQLDRPRDKHNDILLGITEGCDGHIYVAENAGKRIIKILDTGQSETFYTSGGEWFPTGVDFFAGDAYILEYRNTSVGLSGPRIVRINESGKLDVLLDFDERFRN